MNEQQIMQLLQMYAQMNNIPFEQLMQEFQAMPPEQQQQFVQQISQEVAAAQQQAPAQQIPTEASLQEQMMMSEGQSPEMQQMPVEEAPMMDDGGPVYGFAPTKRMLRKQAIAEQRMRDSEMQSLPSLSYPLQESPSIIGSPVALSPMQQVILRMENEERKATKSSPKRTTSKQTTPKQTQLASPVEEMAKMYQARKPLPEVVIKAPRTNSQYQNPIYSVLKGLVKYTPKQFLLQ